MTRREKPAKTVGEYTAFESALRKVLTVSHAEIKAKIDAGKRERPKRISSSHAATD